MTAATGSLGNGDQTFEVVWPGNTTPQAVDGSGATPANLCGCDLANVAASTRYVRFFNGPPTMGTSIPVLVVPVLSGQTLSRDWQRPAQFPAGLWVSVSAGMGDPDNTAPANGDVLLGVRYQ